MSETGQILIAGVGNLLLTDDGVGVHAVRALQQDPIPGVTIVDIGTAVLHGLPFVESAERVLVIDAANGGEAPGSIYFFQAGEGTGAGMMTSIHAIGLREAVRWLPQGKSPPALTILGVEPAALNYGTELSEPVRAALPKVVSLARSTVAQWLREREESLGCKLN